MWGNRGISAGKVFAIKLFLFNALFLMQTKYDTPQQDRDKETLQSFPTLHLLLVFTWILESTAEKNLPPSANTLIFVAISIEGRCRGLHASSQTDTL